MPSFRRLTLLAFLMAASAARLPAARTAATETAFSQAVSVTGKDRLAWDIDLLEGTAASSYSFTLYVDGVGRAASGVRCENVQGSVAECSAAVPSLKPGRHVFQVDTILNGFASARSSALVVQVEETVEPKEDIVEIAAASNAGSRRDRANRGEVSEPPTDLAIVPDGRLLVAERDGSVWIVNRAMSVRTRALMLDDIETDGGLGLFAVALHPQFNDNGYVYLAYAARSRAGEPAYRVIRTREVNNTLGEIATILDGVPVSIPGSATMRFGPDQKLYVAIAAGATGGRGAHPYSGTVLRLEDDGTTPRDSQSASAVFARDVGVPRGLTWTPDGGMWIASSDANGCGRVQRPGGATYALGCEVIPSGIAAVREPSDGTVQIWLGRSDRAALSVIRTDDAARPGSPARHREYGHTPAGCVVAHSSGAIYLCVSDSATRVTRLR